MIRSKRLKQPWGVTRSAAGRGESTHAELAWDRSRGAPTRWAVGGTVLGIVLGLIVFAPAAWLASAVASATQQRLLLADARGTLWSGSAVAVLTGGPESRDAASLPGRLQWTFGLGGLGFELRAQQACCLNGSVVLKIQPGFGRTAISLVPPAAGWVGQWPSAWLGGLGTPFNTLQLGGSVRLTSTGLVLESVQGRWRMTGRADVELLNASSRLSTLDTLGSYRLSLSGDAADAGTSHLNLITLDGALRLSGSGSFGPGGLRFRGEASAAAQNEQALSNLLNIIGRRQGARSVISIG